MCEKMGWSFAVLILLLPIIASVDSIRSSMFRKKMFKMVSQELNSSEFEYIYEQIMNNTNLDLAREEQRKNLIKTVLGTLCVILGILGMFGTPMFCVFLEIELNVTLVVFFCVALLFVGCVLRSKRTVEYKNEVIKKLLLGVDPNIRYEEKHPNWVYTNMYLDAGFKDGSINRQYVTDYMEFEANDGAKVSLADLLLQYHSSGKNSTTTDVFSGIVVKIVRDKAVNNEILIQRNTLFKHSNRTKDSNELFEKHFDLYATDSSSLDMVFSEQAKIVLTELYEKYGIMFEVSIKYNCIFIRFFTGDLFEHRGWNLINKKRLHKEYVIFKSILQMINRINEVC